MNIFSLKDLGLTPQQQEETAAAGSSLHAARVTEQHRTHYRVLGEHGELQAEVSGRFAHLALEPSDYPAVGDWVLVDRLKDDGGHALIHRVLSRKSCFLRTAAGTGGEGQVIAANIDTVFICMSLNADFNLRRLERYLSVIWSSGAEPVVVLTKGDLCEDVAVKLQEIAAVAAGAEVVVTAGLLAEGAESVKPFLEKGKTVAFTGSSGVGKSTLINRLMGLELLATGGLRNDDKGRHVTTHRQLLVLPDGAMVIDTPGMRELRLNDADLSRSFSEIEDLAVRCRFKDCTHKTEPGCAVREALESGTFTAERLQSYEKLQKELADATRRGTMNTTLAEKDKIITMMGSLKARREISKGRHKNKR